jgi:hypothetical protein
MEIYTSIDSWRRFYMCWHEQMKRIFYQYTEWHAPITRARSHVGEIIVCNGKERSYPFKAHPTFDETFNVPMEQATVVSKYVVSRDGQKLHTYFFGVSKSVPE